MPEHAWEPDRARVQAAIDGDAEARNALWRQHRPWLAAILLSYRPREVEIEDLMQEVALKFVSKIHTLRDPAAFKSWLRRTAINAAREAARSIRGMRGASSSDDLIETRHDGPAADATTRDEAHGLLAHAMTLPPEFREPLLLRCVNGLGCKQIAELLDLPITTVETRLSRARRMLRDEWTRDRVEDRNEEPVAAVARRGNR